ncbi:hypothetical protein BDP27DRAFT_1419301 [Rhodocollybia butyracea]|uniref:Uncharacterized protein n=1 Tax=Rhodocollybia butyracea TaxID=206335 RepID=A0A9P5UAN7_9AGAR|nr:hypothetical protein BDP27DRAFT_1419301 [Rhodocollybia butyracea]
MLITPHVDCVGFIFFAVLISTVHAMPAPPRPLLPVQLPPLRNIEPAPSPLRPILPSIQDTVPVPHIATPGHTAPPPGHIAPGLSQEGWDWVQFTGSIYRVTFLQVNSQAFTVAEMDFTVFPEAVEAGKITQNVISRAISGVFGPTDPGPFYTNRVFDNNPQGVASCHVLGGAKILENKKVVSSVYALLGPLQETPKRFKKVKEPKRKQPATLDSDFWNQFPREKFQDQWLQLKAAIDRRFGPKE